MRQTGFQLAFAVCILSVAAGGCGLQEFSEQASERQHMFESKTRAFQERLNTRGKAVRVKVDIAAGQKIDLSQIEEVETELYRIPIDALVSPELVGGKSVKH